jgi:ABC-type Fe3+/spermidine/putrescine transport system ATPase subunit
LPEIVVEGISKTLGGLLTLGEISLKAVDQEFVGILGPSGCGKSTLFNIISGLILPDAGRGPRNVWDAVPVPISAPPGQYR